MGVFRELFGENRPRFIGSALHREFLYFRIIFPGEITLDASLYVVVAIDMSVIAWRREYPVPRDQLSQWRYANGTRVDNVLRSEIRWRNSWEVLRDMMCTDIPDATWRNHTVLRSHSVHYDMRWCNGVKLRHINDTANLLRHMWLDIASQILNRI